MKLYLCGPVSLGGTCTREEEELNVEKFHIAERQLTSAGFEVESPVKIEGCPITGDSAARWQWYMKRAVAQMLTCDAVATLDHVNRSSGCVTEMFIANRFGMSIKTLNQWLECG